MNSFVIMCSFSSILTILLYLCTCHHLSIFLLDMFWLQRSCRSSISHWSQSPINDGIAFAVAVLGVYGLFHLKSIRDELRQHSCGHFERHGWGRLRCCFLPLGWSSWALSFGHWLLSDDAWIEMEKFLFGTAWSSRTPWSSAPSIFSWHWRSFNQFDLGHLCNWFVWVQWRGWKRLLGAGHPNASEPRGHENIGFPFAHAERHPWHRGFWNIWCSCHCHQSRQHRNFTFGLCPRWSSRYKWLENFEKCLFTERQVCAMWVVRLFCR